MQSAKQLTAIFLFVFLLTSVLFSTVLAQETTSLPDLVVTAIKVVPEAPKPLKIIDILVTVKNIGPAAADAFRVKLTITSTLTKRVKALGSNESVTVKFSWFGPEGIHTLKVEVNAFNDIEEANVENNFLEQTLALVSDPLPDLVIELVRSTPQHPQPNAPATLEVVVRNVGLIAPTSKAVLRIKNGSSTLRTLFVDPLLPGQSAIFTVAWTPKLGENFLSFEIDTEGRIAELNELNNVLTQTVTVSLLPPTGANLVVRSLEIFPPGAAPGETVTLKATVVNIGEGEAKDFSVQFEADGVTLDTITIDRLAPGGEGQVEVTWVATVGERLIRVKADEPGTIIETDERDNVLVEFVDIGNPINRCGQLIFLELDEQAAQTLSIILNLNEEQVHNVFMPKIKRAMEKDYEGVNVRFTLNRPVIRHSTVKFTGEFRADRLGEAPLDFNNRFKGDTGIVFIGSFDKGLSRGRKLNRSLDVLATALANTASHEAGHFLGLQHDPESVSQQFNRQNMMANGTDTFSGALFADAFFTPENLDFLTGILPLECN